MFAEAEAARLLRVPKGRCTTARRWTQRGKVHSPILRVEPTNSRSVTWAEFVEAGLLRTTASTVCPWPSFGPSSVLLRTEIGVPYRHLIRPFDLPPKETLNRRLCARSSVDLLVILSRRWPSPVGVLDHPAWLEAAR